MNAEYHKSRVVEAGGLCKRLAATSFEIAFTQKWRKYDEQVQEIPFAWNRREK